MVVTFNNRFLSKLSVGNGLLNSGPSAQVDFLVFISWSGLADLWLG